MLRVKLFTRAKLLQNKQSKYCEGRSFHLALIRLFITVRHLITVQDDLAP